MSKRLPHDYIVDVHDFQQDVKGGSLAPRDGVLGRRGAPRRLEAREGDRSRARDPDAGASGDRARRRPPDPDRPPRPEAGQPVPLWHARRRRHEAPRFRLGEGQDEGREEALPSSARRSGARTTWRRSRRKGSTHSTRADVFGSLAAITYESASAARSLSTGRARPVDSSAGDRDEGPGAAEHRRGASQKYHSAGGASTRSSREALCEEPEHPDEDGRSAHADAVGRAYGLQGDHKQWATTSQAELRADDRRGSAFSTGGGRGGPIRLAAPDPFAAPVAAGGGAAAAAVVPAPRAMDAAFQAC